jgi:hypothetical protein
MAVEVRQRETGMAALVRLEVEEGQGGSRGPKRPNRSIGRLGLN